MDLIMDTFYQKYLNCIYMGILILSILFPCFSLLYLQISFFPSFLLTLTTTVISWAFVGQILTIQMRE